MSHELYVDLFAACSVMTTCTSFVVATYAEENTQKLIHGANSQDSTSDICTRFV